MSNRNKKAVLYSGQLHIWLQRTAEVVNDERKTRWCVLLLLDLTPFPSANRVQRLLRPQSVGFHPQNKKKVIYTLCFFDVLLLDQVPKNLAEMPYH